MSDDLKKQFMRGIAEAADGISAGHADETCPIGEAARMVARAARLEEADAPMGDEGSSTSVGWSRKYGDQWDAVFGKQQVGQA